MSNYSMFSDEQLIEMLREGKKDIVDYIMEKYKYLVLQKAKEMYLLGGEQEDLIQEGMIGLFKAVESFQKEKDASFAGYATACITNQLYSAIRAANRKKHIPLNDYISLYQEQGVDSDKKGLLLIDMLGGDVKQNPEHMLLGREYKDFILNYLQKELSEYEQKVFYLSLKEVDYVTIGSLLDKSEKSIDNALQRIRKKGQKVLQEVEKIC